MARRYALILCFVAGLALVFGETVARSSQQATVTPPAETTGVTSQVLAATEPMSAPGQELAVRLTTIAPAGGLVPHTHPGTQLIWLEAGTLHLVAVEGEVPITRAPNDGTPGPAETLVSGQETVLNPGDSWVEAEGVVHYGVNIGDEPAVLRVATLYPAGEPAARPVAATPTS